MVYIKLSTHACLCRGFNAEVEGIAAENHCLRGELGSRKLSSTGLQCYTDVYRFSSCRSRTGCLAPPQLCPACRTTLPSQITPVKLPGSTIKLHQCALRGTAIGDASAARCEFQKERSAAEGWTLNPFV